MKTVQINKIEKGSVFFTCSEERKIFFQLFVNNKMVYEGDMEVHPDIQYFIGHPSLLLHQEAELIINHSEHYPLIGLTNDPFHAVNVLGLDVYNRIKEWLNLSYYEIFVNDDYEIDPSYIASCKIIVDLGSNIGFFTHYCAKIAHNLEKMICVEPDSESNRANQLLNFPLLGDKLYIEEKLFSGSSDTKSRRFFRSKDKEYSTINSTKYKSDIYNQEQIYKPSIQLQDIIEDYDLLKIDLLKIDVEGDESYLLEPSTVSFMFSHVAMACIEIHSEDIAVALKEIYQTKDSSFTKNSKGLFIWKNNRLLSKEELPQITAPKKILVKVSCPALGDTLCSTPTIRKISKAYGHPISVQTNRKDVFERNPYVEHIFGFSQNIDKNFDEVFETYNQWVKMNIGMNNESYYSTPIEMKLHMVEARQLHAFGVGMYLYPEELSCDFFPGEQTERSKLINKNWVILHTTQSWECRTWEVEKWQRLVCMIHHFTNLKIAIIGRSHKEVDYEDTIQKNVVRLKDVDADFCEDGNKFQNEYDENAINEMWHMINNAFALISFDSGPIHLAGTTDSHIIQIGASIRPEKTAPWRNASQTYKFHFVGGECTKFCASDAKYSVKEWGTINSIPYVPECQEGYDTFRCQPSPDEVFFKLMELLEDEQKIKI